MKIFKIVMVVAITLVIIIGTALFLVGYLKPKPAGVFIDTSPASNVYIDGAFVGKTPYHGTSEAKEIGLRIVPTTVNLDLHPFETRLQLVAGIETVVRREFGSSEETSSGDIISFEKTGGKEASLVVVATPDDAQVSIDGVVRGFAPYKSLSISPADHQVTVKSSGYTDRVMTIRAQTGFRLNVFVKLAKANEKKQVSQEIPLQNRIFVKIRNTPTGFLRVRTGPGATGEEIAEVKPGSKYQFLEEDASTGWFKIQYQEPQAGLPNGITGWVSNQYSEKVEEGAENATPSATVN